MKISFAYLDHWIEVQLPDPEDSNTIYVNLWRAEGTFDTDLYNAYLDDYQFTTSSSDPNEWVIEAINSAIKHLTSWGVYYYEPSLISAKTASNADIADIPF